MRWLALNHVSIKQLDYETEISIARNWRGRSRITESPRGWIKATKQQQEVDAFQNNP